MDERFLKLLEDYNALLSQYVTLTKHCMNLQQRTFALEDAFRKQSGTVEYMQSLLKQSQ